MRSKLMAVLCILSITFIQCKNDTKATEKTVEKTIEENTEMEEKENVWKVLFDGTSLDEWRGYLAKDIYPEWTVEDDEMIFTPGSEGGKNIITKSTYTSFILSLEWKISEGGNSGIFWGVHEDKKYKEAYMTGPEIQVLDNESHPDSFVANGTHKAGSLYDMIGCPDEHIKPAGEWNLCVIEINQNSNYGKVSMNGTEVISFPLHGEKCNEMVANSKFTEWEGFAKYRTGHIGLQDHSDKVWYRNIKIKEL